VSSAATLPVGDRTVVFVVAGVPRPQGRKSAITRHGRTVVVESGRALLNPWRQAIAGQAAGAIAEPFEGPVRVSLTFVMPRPKSHYRSGRHADELREDAPLAHSHRPDIDKLTRAVLDALTPIAFADDGQVARLVVDKVYGAAAGVAVMVGPLEPGE
jgi:crossover junction endodeoxyribonuclease RusA